MTDKTEELFLARIREICFLCEKQGKPKFTAFLNERECYIAESIIKACNKQHMFFGGFDSAKRKMLGVFDDYTTVDKNEFPLSCIEISYRKSDILTHRDVLGSLMALGIKRETIGDIVIQEGKAYVFCESKLTNLIIGDVSKIGRIGVKLKEIQAPELSEVQDFEELNCVVSSLRSDCILSSVTKLSREKAASFIKQNGIQINYEDIFSSSKQMSIGDIFSARGFGKFILFEETGQTKSGKTHIVIKKYI